MKETKSTCCYCGVGCGVVIRSEGPRIISVRGDPDHPANFGRLCTKGTNLHLTAAAGGRALHPELRRSRGAPRRRARWDAALDYAASRFADVARSHGPDAVAFYVSGQLLTEDYYVFNKLAKGLVGTNNIDTNSRLCMSSAVAGYKATLGADAPPACYDDVEAAQCILVAGSNAAVAHPVLWRRIEEARERNPAVKIVVVDPRRTETAAAADLHLQIAPGADLVLFNSMLHVLITERMIDRAYIARHTEGFTALERAVAGHRPEAVAPVAGIAARDIVLAARWFGRARASLSLYCQGLNQSTRGTHNNAALVALHLATGQIGRPGAGPFSLTGQPNAMGGREVGGMANLLPAHRDLASSEDRDEVARLWGVPSVPAAPGKTAVEIFRAIAAGEVRAVWIACTNPVQSMPEAGLVRRALERAEFVVVQEAYRDTETARFADLLLPASSWGEKEGTVTNSERRITRVRASVPPPGEARADWAIAADFARRLGPLLGRDAAPLFPYTTPEQIFDEHRETTRGRDLDITGLSYALLESRGPQQWPFPQDARSGKARLYDDGVFPTASGRARFVVAPRCFDGETPDAARPFRLNTGRLRDQWHGMSRTGTVPLLFAHAPEPRLGLHPDDLRALGLRDGEPVRAANARGALVVEVEADAGVRRGDAWLPMHWGSRFLAGDGVNALTSGAFDPVSKQPELKSAAISIAKVDLPHELVVMARVDALGADGVERLRGTLAAFDFGCVSLFGEASACLKLRARSAAAIDAAALSRIDSLLAGSGRIVDYRDAARNVWKRLWMHDGALVAARVCGEPAATALLEDALAHGGAVPPAALMAPARRRAPERVVCLCLRVSDAQIRAAVASGADLAGLQATLKCGTGCGSCVTELRRLCAEPGAFSVAA